jgi:hypothetical protein
MKIRGVIYIWSLSLFALFQGCNSPSGNRGGSVNFSTSDTGIARMVFSEYEHDFGKVAEGAKVGYIFSFKNTGTSDLIIKSASATCGCTVPKFEQKPVRPGDSGTLEVVFDTSGRDGLQTKTVVVSSNAGTPEIILKISAEVIAGN